jgi:hypothetical protein
LKHNDPRNIRMRARETATGERPPASPIAAMRALIADDAYAMTFQTMGQYRSALLHQLTALNPLPAGIKRND